MTTASSSSAAATRRARTGIPTLIYRSPRPPQELTYGATEEYARDATRGSCWRGNPLSSDRKVTQLAANIHSTAEDRSKESTTAPARRIAAAMGVCQRTSPESAPGACSSFARRHLRLQQGSPSGRLCLPRGLRGRGSGRLGGFTTGAAAAALRDASSIALTHNAAKANRHAHGRIAFAKDVASAAPHFSLRSTPWSSPAKQTSARIYSSRIRLQARAHARTDGRLPRSLKGM